MSKLKSFTRIAVCCGAAILAGCAKKEEAAVDTSAMAASTTTPAPAPPAAINLADVAGKWDVRSVPTSGTDTSATTYVLTATSADSGWTITFPGRKPMAVQVRTDADSIMMNAGPFPSVRRKNVQVTTNGVLRLQDGNLAGSTTAHYNVKTADSVLVLTTTGTRAK